jgi:hypothetical protein
MKYIFLILISTQSFAQNLSQVDKTFLPVVKEFISAAKIDRVPNIEKRANNLAIKFGYPEKICADCVTYSFYDKKQIIINKKFWINQSIPDNVKKIAILHELGHTVLLRKHLDDIQSIMNSDAGHTVDLRKNQISDLYKELFRLSMFDQMKFDPETTVENVIQTMGMNYFLTKN